TAALEFKHRGYAPIPIQAGSKRPPGNEWQNLVISEDDVPLHFSDPDGGVRLLLGGPRGRLVDVDLDCPEAIDLAEFFLPETGMIHGRASKPRSHWWYRVASDCRVQQFRDADGKSLVELRGTGGQTVVPPSIHPEGEA